MKQPLLNLVKYPVGILLLQLLQSCSTGKDIYKSPLVTNSYRVNDHTYSFTTYWKVQAFTVSNCTCTQLYITHYKKDDIDFRIFVTDSVFRKTVYTEPDYLPYSNVKVLLATEQPGYTTAFDSMDLAILSQIEQLNNNPALIQYPVKALRYAGYIDDPKYIGRK